MVNQADSLQQSGVNEAVDLLYPDVSLLHWLVCRHGQLNRELDKLGPLLVERVALFASMEERESRKTAREKVRHVDKAIASQLHTVFRVFNNARQQCETTFEDDWSYDVPF